MNPNRQHLPYSNNQNWSNSFREIIEEVSQMQSQDPGYVYIKIDPVLMRRNQAVHPPKVTAKIENSEVAINRITQEAAIQHEINENSLISGLDKIKSDTMKEVQIIRNHYNFRIHQIEKDLELQQFQMDIELKAHQAYLNRDLERFSVEATKNLEELNYHLRLESYNSDLKVQEAKNRLEHEEETLKLNLNKEIQQLIEMSSKEIALSKHETDKIIADYKHKTEIEIEQAKSKANIEISRIECETAIKVTEIESKSKMWELVIDFVKGLAVIALTSKKII